MKRPQWPGWPQRGRKPRVRGPLHWGRASIAAAIPTAVVATVAGVVSYSHIVALALRVGQDPTDAHLLPVSVDGLIVGGTVIILAGSALGWLGVALGVAATLFANVEAGLPHGELNAIVSAWPALAFSVASFLLERWLKSQVGHYGRGGRADPFGGPPLAAIGGGVNPASASQCQHGVAMTADEAVVNAFVHVRDCLDETPSQRQLAASFGLHRTKVASLVGNLNGTGHARTTGPSPQGGQP